LDADVEMSYGEHGRAVKFYGEELCLEMKALFDARGIPQEKHYSFTWPKGDDDA
jgi:hypothetical protein